MINLEHIIENLSSQQKTHRNLRQSDLFDNNTTVKIKQNSIYFPKNQAEYGAKKFIKPWRTGIKSQQQPAKKGTKGGGRKGN